MKKTNIYFVVIAGLMAVLTGLWAQEDYTINCGRLTHLARANGGDRWTWPADFDKGDYYEVNDSDPDIWFLAKDWTDPAGTFYSTAIEFDVFPVSSKKVIKYPYPDIYVDGSDVSFPVDYDEIDETQPADQMVESVFHSSLGITVVKRTYGYSHPDYQDFVIAHFMLINTGEADDIEGVDLDGQVVTDFYFVNHKEYHPGNDVPSYHRPGQRSYWADYYGDEPGDTLKLCYGWDGDDPDNEVEDEGNPNYDTGEFLTPQYDGHGLIHADSSVSDRSHATAQPLTVLRDARYEWRNKADTEKFNRLTDGQFPPHRDTDAPGANPIDEQHPQQWMSVGPYTLNFSDTINVVMFYGVGSRELEECLVEGAKWKAGEINNTEKDAFLRWGKDDLLNKLGRAKRLWENDLQLPGGFNPQPPASMTVESGRGEVTLSWTAPEGDVPAAGYNLYRARGKQDSVLYYILKPDIPGTSYADTAVKIGFDYYYSLTAYDANDVESSQYLLRTSRKSAVPDAIQGTADLSDVRVVPNPFWYDRSAQTNYVGQKDKLMFAGL
ncbi:MAG: fibronectin type III domain-containing protein, partial [Desulfobacterales bacterium]|nr:fibronectin type III domain-containing protein [Desulfobacterales bacterium]